jgi:hypothetical protein
VANIPYLGINIKFNSIFINNPGIQIHTAVQGYLLAAKNWVMMLSKDQKYIAINKMNNGGIEVEKACPKKKGMRNLPVNNINNVRIIEDAETRLVIFLI